MGKSKNLNCIICSGSKKNNKVIAARKGNIIKVPLFPLTSASLYPSARIIIFPAVYLLGRVVLTGQKLFQTCQRVCAAALSLSA